MPALAESPRRTLRSRRNAPTTPNTKPREPLGLYDGNLVQDRIRQWQAQGAAAAPAPDAVSLASSPTSDNGFAADEPSTSRGESKTKESSKRIETSTRMESRRWLDCDSRELVREARSSSTPRKRVVSDEHWKSRRSLQNSPTGASANKEDVNASVQPRIGRNSGREEREERRRRRRETRQSKLTDELNLRNEEPSYENSRDIQTPRRSEIQRITGEDDAITTSPHDRMYELGIRPEDDDGRHRRRSKYADTLARSQASESIGKPRSRKGRIFSKTKDMFSKSDEMPIVSNRVTSIEAWLEEQPDPFVDSNLPDVEVPAPLKIRSPRRRMPVEPMVQESPNKIWNSIQSSDKLPDADVLPRSDGRTRNIHSRPLGDNFSVSTPRSLQKEIWSPPSPSNDESLLTHRNHSPSGLKRRGAKSSRPREYSNNRHMGSRCSPISQFRMADPNIYDKESIPPNIRPCPPTGQNRLSTIASVETFQAREEDPHNSDDMLATEKCSLGRKLTTHQDLMSILSLPVEKQSLKSAASIKRARTHKNSQPSSVSDLLQEMNEKEELYLRELKTLVDEVVPVLLQAVLSKSESAAAAGLFTSSTTACDDLSFTQPIVDMGVAVEKLYRYHSRRPKTNCGDLLAWAQSCCNLYTKYFTAWRLGFSNVFVSLEPLEKSRTGMEEGLMAQDESGDVVNSEGKKVDVAYLLKRPLLRARDMAEMFREISVRQPSGYTKNIAEDFATLSVLARKRNKDEKQRVEDEAAANVDATRTRDLHTMAALSRAAVNRNRIVMARDCFNMTLHHSSGERLDCRVEVILRESKPGLPAGGDVLLCQVEDQGKWLLFPPIEIGSISARKDEKPSNLVMMVRGRAGLGEWHELLLMRAEDSEAATEWMQMLGSNPLPPKLDRSPSFTDRQSEALRAVLPAVQESPAVMPLTSSALKELAGREVEVPIGEQSILGRVSKMPCPLPHASYLDVSLPTAPEQTPVRPTLPLLSLGGGLQQKQAREYQMSSTSTGIKRKPVPSSQSLVSSDRSTISGKSADNASANGRSSIASRPLPEGRMRDDGFGRREELTGAAGSSPRQAQVNFSPGSGARSTPTHNIRTLSRTDEMSREWMSSPEILRRNGRGPDKLKTQDESDSSLERPVYHRAPSSPLSKDLPTVSRLRPAASQSQPTSHSLNNSVRDQWAAISGSAKPQNGSPRHSPGRSKHRRPKGHPILPYTEDIPVPPAHRSRSAIEPFGPSNDQVTVSSEVKPLPPVHREIEKPQGRAETLPIQIKKTSRPATRTIERKRHSSSPLKHEYAPSTASETDLHSDSDDSSDSSSVTSEDGDTHTPLVAVTVAENRRSSNVQAKVAAATGPGTLAPSDSASQGPYRSVPRAKEVPPEKKLRTVAMVCSWSDAGHWLPLQSEDLCSIIVSPGLIEVFEMSAAHSAGSFEPSAIDPDSRTSSLAQQPLVAFELTPLVPLRRGTALDISIRSPPTPNSKVKTSNNVMFRLRSARECEGLYTMLNFARINNPTYIALQRARPRDQYTVSFNTGQKDGSRSRSSSWFNFGDGRGANGSHRSSFRASSAPVPGSVAGASDAQSTASRASAFSALRRFGANSRFNLNRSSVIRRNGRPGAASLYSSSSGTQTGSGSSSASPAESQLGAMPGRDGLNVPGTSNSATQGSGMVNSMKVRLYVRMGPNWRHLGAARLTVQQPLKAIENTDARPMSSDGTMTLANAQSATGGRGGTVAPTRPASMSMAISTGASNSGPRLPSSSHTPHRTHGHSHEKRIILRSHKNADYVLLDAVLGEACFERVMQTGIAISVWRDDGAVVRDQGGVTGGHNETYMVQFAKTSDAAWVFSMVGRYRYE